MIDQETGTCPERGEKLPPYNLHFLLRLGQSIIAYDMKQDTTNVITVTEIVSPDGESIAIDHHCDNETMVAIEDVYGWKIKLHVHSDPNIKLVRGKLVCQHTDKIPIQQKITQPPPAISANL